MKKIFFIKFMVLGGRLFPVSAELLALKARQTVLETSKSLPLIPSLFFLNCYFSEVKKGFHALDKLAHHI
ncbi:MAG: hypothetical protein A3G32_03405 [Deltaproteobacteria bacterium RIFCSPLOWO2_12_FULL_40_28]|nr:MAG: hypothetical protein A3C45_02090 [Deltaproteobacteria bacterium RIFCSPHIGHO2_02_FULL_40_28]OGQ20142.1 MAG: hypothetical protein A3E27_01385 [Deltaproteobacteria bacterium RIFCSPHIGHO2_12_FULL_40_32]OGQ40713.1 MAG: hypothetical protein A3I69_02650 [Deltaproteobacteria bacterium RIFCSPLOWO2_02_FULL_40_36]OGQ54409.1 MAG: hypothetical protein A3G32_03405 [Deltaproteobacteria bacterium RIFCSPLOWO2_12_FULL_40_28]